MNRTLKETLTKLAQETGGDWVTLLPYALYRVCNTPYRLGLIPFEIMFGRPPLIIPALQSEVINALDADGNVLIRSLQTLQRAHRDVWTRLKALYETDPPPRPHCFQLGDWVLLVKRHHRETLELRWKGRGHPHHPRRAQGRWPCCLDPSHPRAAGRLLRTPRTEPSSVTMDSLKGRKQSPKGSPLKIVRLLIIAVCTFRCVSPEP